MEDGTNNPQQSFRVKLLQQSWELRHQKKGTTRSSTDVQIDDIGKTLNSKLSFYSTDKLYFNDQTFSDVTLTVNGYALSTKKKKKNDNKQRYFAHKVVLAGKSEFFRRLLEEQKTWQENDTNTIHIEVEESVLDCIEDFLKYMYSGNVELSKDTIWPFYFLADQYMVESLHKIVAEFVSRSLLIKCNAESYVEDVYEIRGLYTVQEAIDIAQYLDNDQVTQHVGAVLLANIHDEPLRSDFNALNISAVSAILDANTIKEVNNERQIDEFKLFKKVVRWIDADPSRREDADALLSRVRYGRMHQSAELRVVSRQEYVRRSATVSRLVALVAQEFYFSTYPTSEPVSESEFASYQRGVTLTQDTNVFKRRYYREELTCEPTQSHYLSRYSLN